MLSVTAPLTFVLWGNVLLNCPGWLQICWVIKTGWNPLPSVPQIAGIIGMQHNTQLPSVSKHQWCSPLFLFLLTFITYFLGGGGVHMRTMTWEWRSEDNLESVLPSIIWVLGTELSLEAVTFPHGGLSFEIQSQDLSNTRSQATANKVLHPTSQGHLYVWRKTSRCVWL